MDRSGLKFDSLPYINSQVALLGGSASRARPVGHPTFLDLATHLDHLGQLHELSVSHADITITHWPQFPAFFIDS